MARDDILRAAGDCRPNILDRYLGPGWRADAVAAENHWIKTFQTPSERTLLAREQEARIKHMGRGSRPW